MDNFLKKKNFAHLVKDAKSFASFSPFCQFQAEQNDIKLTQHGCQDSIKMVASEVASFKKNFFRIEGTSEAKTLVSGKAECFY